MRRIMQLAFNQRLDQALDECERMSSVSLYHAYGKSVIKAVLATNLKKVSHRQQVEEEEKCGHARPTRRR